VQRGVKATPEKLRAALTGRVSHQHRFLLRLHLRQVDALDAALAEIDAKVDRDLDLSVRRFANCGPYQASVT
jgi:hypothetical protein